MFLVLQIGTLSLDHYLYHSFSLFCSLCQEFIHISRGMRGLLDGSIVSTCLPCYSDLHSSTLMQRQKYPNCQYNFSQINDQFRDSVSQLETTSEKEKWAPAKIPIPFRNGNCIPPWLVIGERQGDFLFGGGYPKIASFPILLSLKKFNLFLIQKSLGSSPRLD